MYLILWGLKTWAIVQGDNRTALSYAALGGHVEVVAALLAKGANMEAKTKVLPWACKCACQASGEGRDILSGQEKL